MMYEEALKVLMFVCDYSEIKGPFQRDGKRITNYSNYWHAMHADGAMRVVAYVTMYFARNVGL